MKKIFCLVLAAIVGLAVIGCGTTGGSSSGGGSASAPTANLPGVPEFVNEAYMNASEDVLIGVGTYKIGNNRALISQGKTMAETRARADIARQMDSIVKNMVNDYTATSELDPDAAVSFQESITQALSKAELKGTRTLKMDTDANGVLWLVMEYSRSAAAKDFDAAQSAAKLAVPAAAAFDALGRMDTAFDKAAGGGPKPEAE